MRRPIIVAVAAVLLFALPGFAAAETKAVRVMQQYGLPYVPLMIMQSQQLIEKHAKAAGITDLTVSYNQVAGASQSADALLTDSADFVSVGVPTLITLWSKTHGTSHEIRGLSAEQSMPFYLITSNPAIHTLKDFTDKDRIAVQGVKISAQALVLEMAAAQTFGQDNYAKLDPLTIQMSHPDALAALLSGHSEVTAHLGVAPFQNYELADKRLHLVFSSYDILGGKHTNGVLATSKRFHDANPKVVAAVFAAQQEANAFIKAHPHQAAEIYQQLSNDKRNSIDDIAKMLADPENDWTVVPAKVGVFVTFMHDVGRISSAPDSWKDLFFDNVQSMPGS